MNIRYGLLLAATAAGLASCSPNSSQQDELLRSPASTSPTGPTAGRGANPATEHAVKMPAADSTATQTVAIPEHRMAADSPYRGAEQSGVSMANEAAATAAADCGSPVGNKISGKGNRHPSSLANGRQRSKSWHGRRGPNTLADAPTLADDRSEATGIESEATAELSRFLATGLPPAQQLEVRPGRDTVVVGPQGTQILLPARIWNLPAADSNAVVRLALQEFYTAADMLLAGLSTTSGPNLLETGGMLRLTATANGRPVQLRPDRYLHLRMPTKKAKADMQLFEGMAIGPQQAVDWQLPGEGHAPDGLANGPKKRRNALRTKPAAHAQHNDSAYAMHPRARWPVYARGMDNQLRALLPQLGRLRRNRKSSPIAKDILGILTQRYDERIVRYVSLAFTVDSSGTMRQVVPSKGSDPALTPAISAILLRMVPTKPAGLPYFVKRQVVYESAAAAGVVHIDFARSGRIIINEPTWKVAQASKLRARVLKHQVDSLLADKSFATSYRRAQDSLAVTQRGLTWAKYQAEQARLSTQFTDTSRAAITEQGVFNELSAQGIGWINCDRFLRANRLVTLKVESPGTTATITSLLFEDINSVMRGLPLTGTVTAFDNVPARMRATVVAIKREAGITYLATQKLVVSGAPVIGLAFHPVTMAQLRAELNLLQ